MNALHYAAYFDVPELIRVLLKASKPRGTHTRMHSRTHACTLLILKLLFEPPPPPAPTSLIVVSTVLNSTCSDFHYGTALHIAASNLCLGAVKCLLEHGANPTVRVKSLILSKFMDFNLTVQKWDWVQSSVVWGEKKYVEQEYIYIYNIHWEQIRAGKYSNSGRRNQNGFDFSSRGLCFV